MNALRMGTLVVLPARPLAGDPAALEALAGAAEASRFDVRLKTATGRAGILARGPERAAMAARAGHIRALGHAAAVVTDAEVASLPLPRVARGVTPEGALAFLDARGMPVAAPPPGASLWIGVAHLRRPQPNSLPMNPGLVAAPDRAAVTTEVAEELAWLCEADRAGLVIDVAWNEGAERVRLRGERLVFATLGAHAAPSAARNVAFVLGRLTGSGHPVTLDLEFEQFQPPRLVVGAGRAAGAGACADVDRPRDDRESAWESYVRFGIAMWQLGMYDVVATPVTWAGTAVRVTRSSVELGLSAAGRLGAAHRPSEGDTGAPGRPIASTPRSERAVLLPHRDDGAAAAPGGLADWKRRWHDRLATVGPVPWVAGLGLGTAIYLGMTVLTEGGAPWRQLAALGAGLLALTHALALFQRRRLVEDAPASRIRSAAIGPCEIHGHARAGAPLRTPFSRMPCVWYEYRMERREPVPAGADASRERVHVVTGHSNDVPFYVEDDTGRIEIDPRGAQVEVGTVQTLGRVPFDGAPLPAGTKVTITERYIPVDQPIFVRGHLRVEGDAEAGRADRLAAHLKALKADTARMASGDENGDGVIDPLEWERLAGEARREWEASRLSAEGRTDRLVLGRSESGGFFYITERSESAVVRRFGIRAAFWFVMGLVLSAWGLVSLAAASARKG